MVKCHGIVPPAGRRIAAAIAKTVSFRRAALEHAEFPARRAALEHAEREEARERGQAEDESGLPTGELRRRSYQVLDGLTADVSRKLLHALGRTASEARELRSVLVQAIGGGTHGPRHMAGQIGATRDLHVQKAFGLLAGVGRQRSGGVFRLTAGLLRGVGDFRDGLTGFGAHVLRHTRCR